MLYYNVMLLYLLVVVLIFNITNNNVFCYIIHCNLLIIDYILILDYLTLLFLYLILISSVLITLSLFIKVSISYVYYRFIIDLIIVCSLMLSSLIDLFCFFVIFEFITFPIIIFVGINSVSSRRM